MPRTFPLTCGPRASLDSDPERILPDDKGDFQTSSPVSTSPDLPPLTTTTERKLMAKVDWHVVPALCVMYLLAFLDRYVFLYLSALRNCKAEQSANEDAG